jgi:hypothetical protein
MLGSLLNSWKNCSYKEERWDKLHEREEEIQPKTKLTQPCGNMGGKGGNLVMEEEEIWKDCWRGEERMT